MFWIARNRWKMSSRLAGWVALTDAVGRAGATRFWQFLADDVAVGRKPLADEALVGRDGLPLRTPLDVRATRFLTDDVLDSRNSLADEVAVSRDGLPLRGRDHRPIHIVIKTSWPGEHPSLHNAPHSPPGRTVPNRRPQRHQCQRCNAVIGLRLAGENRCGQRRPGQ
jgi:hypothetical protein